MKRTSGGQLSLGAVATLLSGHAEGPRAATGDTTFTGQTGRQRRLGSARRQPENQLDASDVTAQTADDFDSERRLRGGSDGARSGRGSVVRVGCVRRSLRQGGAGARLALPLIVAGVPIRAA